MPASEPATNNADTTIGSGIESGIVLVLFVLAGYGLDRWLGTTPVFTLVLFALGAVGLFYRFKAAYTIRMDAYDEERRRHVDRERERERSSMTSEPMPSMLTSKPEGESTEVEISMDMVKRGVIAGPVLIAVCGVIWGADGAWSSAYAIAIVLANFALSAGIITVGSRISYAALLGGVLFGYIFRLALIFAAVYAVKDTSWISMPALGTSIIVTHLGLLVWELKYVAISLAYPGLKPK